MFLYTFEPVKGYFCSLLISNIFLYTSLSRIKVITCSLVPPVPFCVYNITYFKAYFNPQCSIKLKASNYAERRNITEEH